MTLKVAGAWKVCSLVLDQSGALEPVAEDLGRPKALIT